MIKYNICIQNNFNFKANKLKPLSANRGQNFVLKKPELLPKSNFIRLQK